MSGGSLCRSTSVASSSETSLESGDCGGGGGDGMAVSDAAAICERSIRLRALLVFKKPRFICVTSKD
ncbi:hypothetical protein SERLA73DRAFT_136509, partial [Serpula lacrymans var. lacrymans S7.3]